MTVLRNAQTALGGSSTPASGAPRCCKARLAMASTSTAGCSSRAMDRSRNGRSAPCRWRRPATSLSALSVKQALQLQSLLAAQHRADTLSALRETWPAEEEARQRFQTFVGSGSRLSPGR